MYPVWFRSPRHSYLLENLIGQYLESPVYNYPIVVDFTLSLMYQLSVQAIMRPARTVLTFSCTNKYLRTVVNIQHAADQLTPRDLS